MPDPLKVLRKVAPEEEGAPKRLKMEVSQCGNREGGFPTAPSGEARRASLRRAGLQPVRRMSPGKEERASPGQQQNKQNASPETNT